MLLFIAFLCFAALFAAWIVAPSAASVSSTETLPRANVPEAGTQPA